MVSTMAMSRHNIITMDYFMALPHPRCEASTVSFLAAVGEQLAALQAAGVGA